MIDIFISIILFILGSALGSFASVWVDRDERNEKFISGRSYCEKCKKELKPIDLIPIFSFLSLKGKCRYCKAKIPPSLFIVEMLFGWVFVLSYQIYKSIYGFNNENIYALIFVTVFMIFLLFTLSLIFLSDLKYMMISDAHFYMLGVLYALGFIAFEFFKVQPLYIFYADIFTHLIGGAIMLVFFGSIVLISREKLMGQGDIYLATILGLFLGWELTMVMWFFAFLIGAIVGLILIGLNLKKIQSAVPFGPFLIIAAYIAFFFGNSIINFYIYNLGY